MATVYEAVDPDLNRRVALKVLREGEAPARLIQRLHSEAAATAKLRHPNIVAVHEVGSVPDEHGSIVHFIAMDFVAGQTLAEAKGAMSRRERMLVLDTIARAVAYAHAQGIVHRDLKPQNVLVEATSIADASGLRWNVFLMDFGLAKILEAGDLTRTGTALGTPHYMAPEQVRGDTRRMGARTDVWSLGVMLYELLTDKYPFPGTTAPDIYQRILTDDPVALPSSVPPDLETICFRALEKDPERRYASATAMADDLRHWLDGEPIQARPLSTLHRVTRRLRRNLPATAAVLLLFAVAGIAAVTLSLQSARARRELEEEQARNRRREAALQRLAAQWATILERKRELRLLRSPPDVARRELESAVREVQAHIAEWPDDPQGYYVRARGYAYLGNNAAAKADAETALARCAEFRPAWSLLGMLHLEEYQSLMLGTDRTAHRRLQRQRETLQRACAAFDKGWPEGHEEDEARRWGLVRSREDGVLENLARAFRMMGDADGMLKAGHFLVDRLREFKAEEYASVLGLIDTTPEARVTWQGTAIEWAPGYGRAWLRRSYARHGAGDLKAALADIERAAELGEHAAAMHVNRGNILLDLQRPEQALAAYSRAAEEDPALAEAHSNVGMALRALGRLQEALAAFDRAIELAPDLLIAFLNRGVTRRELGDAKGAVDDYDRAIAIDGTSAAAHINRGHARMALGDVSGTSQDFDRAIDLGPTIPECWASRAAWRTSRGDRPGAIADYAETLRVASTRWPGRAGVEQALKALRNE